jgi:tetratricopeptide (TPR) repeat protein
MRSLIALMVLLVHPVIAQDLYNKEHSKAFAEYLFKSGQYHLAAIELERITFNEPDNDSLKVMLVRAYSLEQSFDQALRTIQRLYPKTEQLQHPFASLFAYNLIEADETDKAMAMLRVNSTLSPEQKLWYEGFAYLKKNEFKKTLHLFSNTDLQNGSLLKLKTLAQEGAALRLKKPWLAASMSTLVPGTGKLYTGDWKDALISMVSVGLTGYQAYKGFERNGVKSTYGWIYATVGTGFYLGNIYGSVASAKRRNKRNLNRIKAKVDDTFRLHP